jgi:hypothetical protein
MRLGSAGRRVVDSDAMCETFGASTQNDGLAESHWIRQRSMSDQVRVRVSVKPFQRDGVGLGSYGSVLSSQCRCRPIGQDRLEISPFSVRDSEGNAREVRMSLPCGAANCSTHTHTLKRHREAYGTRTLAGLRERLAGSADGHAN